METPGILEPVLALQRIPHTWEELRALHKILAEAYVEDGWRSWIHNNAAGVDEHHFAFGDKAKPLIWIEVSQHGLFVREVSSSESLMGTDLASLLGELEALHKLCKAVEQLEAVRDDVAAACGAPPCKWCKGTGRVAAGREAIHTASLPCPGGCVAPGGAT